MKKIPMRTCVVTHTKAEKRNLLRIVRTPLKEILVDTTGKLNGKGAYILKDLEVLEKAKKTKALERALDIDIPESVYEEIKKYI